MGQVTFAVGLPHTPWVPERVESFVRLFASINGGGASDLRVFEDREPNYVWSQKLWRWACSTGATHLLQLQDDAILAPNFWPALCAMVSWRPAEIIGLEAVHPLGPEQFRTGRRWYRTRAWLIGVGYVWPLDSNLENGLPAFLKWCDANPKRVQSTNEDSLASEWAFEHSFDIWHPVPTIIDHDLGVPSTYANDEHYEFSMYRRPTVTWRDIPNLKAIEDEAYWRQSEAPLLPGAGTQLCWYCLEGQGKMVSPKTGARLCRECLAKMLGHLLSRM